MPSTTDQPGSRTAARADGDETARRCVTVTVMFDIHADRPFRAEEPVRSRGNPELDGESARGLRWIRTVSGVAAARLHFSDTAS